VRAAGVRKFLKFSVQNGAFSTIFGNEIDIKLTTFHQKLLCHACLKSGGTVPPLQKVGSTRTPLPPTHSTPMLQRLNKHSASGLQRGILYNSRRKAYALFNAYKSSRTCDKIKWNEKKTGDASPSTPFRIPFITERNVALQLTNLQRSSILSRVQNWISYFYSCFILIYFIRGLCKQCPGLRVAQRLHERTDKRPL